MRYRPLGRTGIEVSAYCLGTMMFGAIANPDHDDCARIIHTALDAASTSSTPPTCTAWARPRRSSARRSGRAATRSCSRRRATSRWATGRTAAATRAAGSHGPSRTASGACGTDWIDLYQVHRPDPATDIEETLGGLSDLVHQGKIRAFGCSTFPAEQIVEAHHVAERAGLLRFRTEQPPYSMLARGIETSVLPVCERYGMGVLVWSPLAAGS